MSIIIDNNKIRFSPDIANIIVSYLERNECSHIRSVRKMFDPVVKHIRIPMMLILTGQSELCEYILYEIMYNKQYRRCDAIVCWSRLIDGSDLIVNNF